jgi:hypothetical protein
MCILHTTEFDILVQHETTQMTAVRPIVNCTPKTQVVTWVETHMGETIKEINVSSTLPTNFTL